MKAIQDTDDSSRLPEKHIFQVKRNLHIVTSTVKRPPASEGESFYIKRLAGKHGFVKFSPTRHALFIIVGGREEESIDLGFATSRVLEILIRCAGRVVAREEILNYAWPGRIVTQNSLTHAVKSIRKHLGDKRGKSFIHTLPRHGYQFDLDQLLDFETLPSTAPLRPTNIEMNVSRLTRFPICSLRSVMLSVMLLGLSSVVLLRSDTWKISDNRANNLESVSGGPQLDILQGEVAMLRNRLLKLAPTSTTILLSRNGELYEVVCVSDKELSKFLMVHESQVSNISDEQLRECWG